MIDAKPSPLEIKSAGKRRRSAASRYRPKQVELLLIAETPPTDLDRYFYFETVSRADYLFRAVVVALLDELPLRANKARQLAALRDRGVFLVDLRPDPFDTRGDESFIPELIEQVRGLVPRRVILIKVNVYDAAYRELKEAGLPVVDARLPFPSTGRQREFAAGFRRALDSAP